MKTYRVSCLATERFVKSGDLIIEIDNPLTVGGDETEKRALIKEKDFEIGNPEIWSLDQIGNWKLDGYVHAQIVDENADSLLLNLPHPYTGEDNLFRVEKEVEEEIDAPTLTHDWVDAFSSKLVKDCARTMQVPEEILREYIDDAEFPAPAPRAIAQSDDSYRNYLLRYLECRDTPQKY